jgi:N-acetylneuraminic acid mutarotase
MMKLDYLVVPVLVLCTSIAAASADVPALINSHGRILTGDSVFEGLGGFKFALTDSAGSVYWANGVDHDLDGEPDSSVMLSVTRGIYSVTLGDTNLDNMLPLSAQVFTNSQVYLRVWFDDGVNGFQRLMPDQRVTAVGYALMAATVPDGAISLSKLAPGTLHAANLLGTLSPAQIPGLDATKISSGILDAGRMPNVDAAKVTSGTFDPDRIPGLEAAKVTSGSFPASRLPGNVAYTDTDLVSASNALTSQFTWANAVLSSEVSALTLQLDSVSDRLNLLSARIDATALAGLTVVSSSAQDAGLISRGFTPFMTVPSPAWASGAKAEAPSPRSAHSSIWTGAEWIIWGGDLGGGFSSGNGSIYNPALDQWRAVSPVDAPPARSGHTAVWTGQEMIVWGGFAASGGFLSSGARFQPARSLWLPLPAAANPTGRLGHIAAWTGSRMIIWGGRNSGGLLNDGALYDPELNHWRPLELAGAPSARSGAAAVWTGNRLIVWGGEGSSGLLESGAQLLFDASGFPLEWRPLTTSMAPSPRSGHTAVWTGQEMIVWGGQTTGTFFGDGAAYNPWGNNWRALSSAAAPSGRSGHNALWTGEEMVVLGGIGPLGVLASGSAYHPSSNQWRALGVLGQPQPRSGAAATWTGSVLLLFGGQADGLPLSSLESLNPQPPWHFYRKL